METKTHNYFKFNFRLAIFLLGAIFLLKGVCLGFTLHQTDNRIFSLEAYLRNDLVTYKNTVDLDSSNSDDTTTYLGIDYNLAFKSEPKESGPRFYLRLERNGPGDYDFPLFIHNTLINSGGKIDAYHNEDLLPQLEEFWMDVPLANNFGFKSGLYTYEVGHGFSLNGSYENYGFTFYRELENFAWRLYYCRPDLVYKNRLGPRIRQDEEQGYEYNHNSSNFLAADIKFGKDENFLQPYAGVLADYTSPDKRDKVFAASIKRDILGTFGLAGKRTKGNLTFNFEAARNFGRAKSADSQYKDIYHTGYLIYSDIDYKFGKFIPALSFLAASGNKVTPDMAQNLDETLTGAKNRAFSSYSPLNKNLGDSISACNAEARPIVFMGSCCGLHYGIPRPKTLAASDFDNIIITCLGSDFVATDKMTLGLYGYYLRSFRKGAGTLNSEGKYLSADLGYELDFTLDYKVNRNILVSFAGGYFFPGKHYKEKRDYVGVSILSPYVRGDGEADGAYQIEFSVEFQF